MTTAVRIAGTASVRPGRAVTTTEIAALAAGSWNADEVIARTGIVSRQWAAADTTHAELGVAALRAALETASLPATALQRIIFASSAGGDLLAPATANAIAAGVGLRGTCDAFDVNNGCVGFLTALDIGAHTVAANGAAVGLVMVELGSRYITPDDPRPFFVTGDAAAAVVLTPSQSGAGLIASWLRNNGSMGGISIRHPGLTGERELIRFEAANATIGEQAMQLIAEATAAVVQRAGLLLGEIEWIVPHQPNGGILAKLIATLGLDPDRVVQIARHTGSVGAACIPMALDALLRSGRPRPGDRILMVGMGAGAAVGAAIYRVGS